MELVTGVRESREKFGAELLERANAIIAFGISFLAAKQ